MITDLIANSLVILTNGASRKKEAVNIPASKMLKEIMRIFKEEGFIRDFKEMQDNKQNELRVYLKYDEDGNPVITKIKRISKPSLRVYRGKDDMPEALGGLGVTIVSTPAGILTDKQAKEKGTGGEVICQIW